MKRIVFISLCILALIACEAETEKKRKAQAALNADPEHIAMMHELNYRQPAVLLSLKYDLAEDDVFKILVEYDSGISQLERMKKKKTDSDSLFVPMNKNEIFECAKKFNITPKTMAAIIIDFESMKQK